MDNGSSHFLIQIKFILFTIPRLNTIIEPHLKL